MYKSYYMKDFIREIDETDAIETLIDLSFCWGGCQVPYKSKLRSILSICFDTTGPGFYKTRHSERVRQYLNKKGIKGKNKFQIPELIAWCGCEPKVQIRRDYLDGFKNKLYEMADAHDRRM